MSWGVPSWVYFIWYSLCFLDLSEWFLSHVREVLSYYLIEYFFCPLLSVSGTPIIWMLVCLTLSQSSPRLSSFVFNLSYLFCSASIISTNLCSTSLIRSSASYILLLLASSEFFISVIVFYISSCLSFISCISLVSVSCKLSIFASSLFPMSCIIFSINSLKTFSWRLRIFSYT